MCPHHRGVRGKAGSEGVRQGARGEVGSEGARQGVRGQGRERGEQDTCYTRF